MPLKESAASSLDEHGRGYPRPQLRRDPWYSLNGTWDFALDRECRYRQPSQVEWSDQIRVPFAPEAPASGIGQTAFLDSCWYRRRFTLPPLEAGERWILHFGAVDFTATVWVNDSYVGEHHGGYTPFSFDITEVVRDEDCEIVVRAHDDPHDLAKPRGKQDWLLEPHSIWYPRTTGIWQTVWLERAPATRIARICYTPDLTHWQISLSLWLEGPRHPNLRLSVTMRSGDTLLADDTYQVISSEVHRSVALSDPGIDDSRNVLLWSPQTPNLIDVLLELRTEDGDIVDSVRSYTALRTIGTQGDRFVLNGRPYLLRMILDQGYWPDGGLTAPDDEALKRDVTLAREMGFNGVRKHQKLEDPRYLYWADTLGLMVWAEMPSAYRFTQKSVHRLVEEWMVAIHRDVSHPCVIAWVPINESWGVPNLPSNDRERHYVQSLYHLTKTLDTTRPVVGNDGWESVSTDIIGIHDYDDKPDRIARRYRIDDMLSKLFKHERPGGRQLVLGEAAHADIPLMLTEFGGIALADTRSRNWGYTVAESAEEFAMRYEQLLKTVRGLALMAGFCYTQFSDTYQEANGLLYMDRTPKIPLARIHAATSGPGAARSDGLEQIRDPSEIRVSG